MPNTMDTGGGYRRRNRLPGDCSPGLYPGRYRRRYCGRLKQQLQEIAANGLRLSPIAQVLIERCIAGWKEIEYEVMRDRKRQCALPCATWKTWILWACTPGIRIVVAPCSDSGGQGIPDAAFSAALDIISALKIEGGCNCQFALNPSSFEYAVIEVNPRVSPLLGLGVQGNRLSHCKGGGQNCVGLYAGRNPERGDGKDLRLLRTGAGLRAWSKFPRMAV